MTLTPHSLFAIISLEELSNSLTLILTGFLVVMSGLVILWLGISVSGKIFTWSQARTKRKNDLLTTSITHKSPAETPQNGISGTTLALIAAAVQTTVQGPYRILGVEHRHSNHEPEPMVSTWSVEGRRSIFSSHRVR